eukprot:comp16407_c0_seq1/m.14316 comp16407_c0_seq1/g.14316  ORF comp16407_c0_seq1/g.14316 comp16407_c0_seq1/m.14316 type:complete len:142 (-) comp16407_c0_seq1:295-720(-)
MEPATPSLCDLPNEILLLVLQHLDGIELASAQRVCRRWAGLIDTSDVSLWGRMCRQKGWWLPDQQQRVGGIKWKNVYRYHYAIERPWVCGHYSRVHSYEEWEAAKQRVVSTQTTTAINRRDLCRLSAEQWGTVLQKMCCLP